MTTRTYNPHMVPVSGLEYATNIPHQRHFRPMADLESFGVIQHRKFDDEAYFQRQNTEETQYHADSMLTKPIEHLRPYSADSAPSTAPRMIRLQHHVARAQSRQNPIYHNLNEELYNEPSGNIAIRRISEPEYDYTSRYSTVELENNRKHVFDDDKVGEYTRRLSRSYSLPYRSNIQSRLKSNKKISYSPIIED